MTRIWIWAAGVAVGVTALAGCGGYGGSSSSSGTTSSASSSAATAGGSASGATLKTANSDVGSIVVDAKGMTVYVFDKDTADSGSSACTGQCATMWPAVTAESASPGVEGVMGQVGTITRDDGTKQVTLNGHPLYTYSGDSAAGDVAGQGVGGVWWVVGPDGAKIAGEPSMSGGSGGSGGY